MSAKRKPLFSDDEVDAFKYTKVPGHPTQSIMEQRWTPRQVRDFYEAKITSGELMVVNTVKWLDCKWYRGSGRGSDWYRMACCNYRNEATGPTPYCPGCGAKIVEP